MMISVDIPPWEGHGPQFGVRGYFDSESGCFHGQGRTRGRGRLRNVSDIMKIRYLSLFRARSPVP
jgi:hypothetical protein